MIRRPPRSTLDRSSAASDVYKRQGYVITASSAGVMSWPCSFSASSMRFTTASRGKRSSAPIRGRPIPGSGAGRRGLDFDVKVLYIDVHYFYIDEECAM